MVGGSAAILCALLFSGVGGPAETDLSERSPRPALDESAEERRVEPAPFPAEEATRAASGSYLPLNQVDTTPPPPENSPGESLIGYLKLDLRQLDQVVRESRTETPPNVQIAFPMPDGRSRVAAFRLLRRLTTDGSSWQLQGTVPGAEYSTAVLTKWKGAIFGSVNALEGGNLEWRQAKDGRIAVYQFNASRLPDCDTDGLTDKEPQAQQATPQPLLTSTSAEPGTAAAGAKNVIDIVVGYNHQARISLGGSATVPTDVAAIEAKILTALADANLAYSTSAIDLEMRVAWMGLIDYPYPASETFDRALDEISDASDGNADELSRLKAQYQADFACLWLDNTVTGGLATVITSAANGHFAYSVVRAKNPTATFVHEIGHNMGCRHLRDGYATTPTSWAPDAFAHQFVGLDAKTYVTVMASTQDETRTGGTRLLRFSNSNLTYQGRPTGVVATADCARHLQEIRQSLEDFRPSPVKDVRLTRTGTQSRVTLAKGFVAKKYSLWRTPDLLNWSPLGYATTDSKGETVKTDGTTLPKAFYRWREEP